MLVYKRPVERYKTIANPDGVPPLPLGVLYMPTDTLYQCAKFKMPAKMRPLLDIFYTKR